MAKWVWDEYNAEYVCDRCGNGTLCELTPSEHDAEIFELVQRLTPFCPYCGNKMEGE